jgi:hypothetical protein
MAARRARPNLGADRPRSTSTRCGITVTSPSLKQPVRADQDTGGLRPTLLAAAFDLGDPDKANELADEVIDEGQAAWKVQSVLGDLEASVLQLGDAARSARLSAIIDRIKSS